MGSSSESVSCESQSSARSKIRSYSKRQQHDHNNAVFVQVCLEEYTIDPIWTGVRVPSSRNTARLKGWEICLSQFFGEETRGINSSVLTR